MSFDVYISRFIESHQIKGPSKSEYAITRGGGKTFSDPPPLTHIKSNLKRNENETLIKIVGPL